MRAPRPFRPTFVLRLYGALANLAAPFAYRKVAAKLTAANVAPARIRERTGHATAPRPAGPLVWFHAASVGESVSILALVTRMGRDDPALNFLITSGTATSAEIVASRMPPRTQHQFAPLDSAIYLRRFLGHWAPQMAIFVESELWPQMIVKTAKTGIPMALLNARISASTARSWARIPATARRLLALFSMIKTQTDDTKNVLISLGSNPETTGHGPNLKAAAAPLPHDPLALAALRAAINNRPLWVASSTHPGEEEIILKAHEIALAQIPDLLLILVPRHPARADDIRSMITAANMGQTRRSAGQNPETATQIYLADTMGETGLWYALSPLVFLAGSLSDVGGHNPYEPAQSGAAILVGPNVANFAETYAELDKSGGCLRVNNADDIGAAVISLLTEPAQLSSLRASARRFAQAQETGLDGITQDLFDLLKKV